MELLFTLPQSEADHKCALRYTSEKWDIIRPTIEQLYIQKENTLKEVIDILEQEHGFIASEKQLKRRLTRWGLFKYIRGDVMLQMALERVKRKMDGKESAFIVHNGPVPQRNINRYLKRNNLSEEDLLPSASLMDTDAPSPDFIVYTPRPGSPSNTHTQVTDSTRASAPPWNQYTSLLISLDSSSTDASRTPVDHAYSSCHQPAHCTGKNYSALTTSRDDIAALTRGESFLTYLPPHVQNRPESPEMLLMGFRERVCPWLSIAEGQSNLWWTLVLPLVHNSQLLYQAISAVTALKIARDTALRVHGEKLMQQSLETLRRDLWDQTISVTTLATILLLAFWTRWDQGLNTGKVHIMGALALLPTVWSMYLMSSLGTLPGYSCSLLAFLHDTCSRMDSLSRLVRSTMATDQYKTSNLLSFDEFRGEHSASGPHLYHIDPWMGCVRRLFPLISRTADLCHEVRRTSINSTVTIERAESLKWEIEGWNPDLNILDADNSTLDIDHILHTAEAYRYATLLYLHQIIPEVFSGNSQQISANIFAHLTSVPPNSRLIVVQNFPLFVAGCEAITEKERQWVKERWTSMMGRMMVRNIQKCWEITQEIWSRRDAYRRRRNESGGDPHRQAGFEYMGDNGGELDQAFTVKGPLHWASVMKDWEWEVSL